MRPKMRRRIALLRAVAASALLPGTVAMWSLAAEASGRDLDGYARVRFGMTLDEVREARPDGEFNREKGEYWIVTERREPGQASPSSKFRLRVQFNRAGRVDRITNDNLLAADAKDYAECRALFVATVQRLAGQLGDPEKVHVLNEPEFLFGQRYRARNHAYFSFANGATADVYAVWDEYRVFTRLVRDTSCSAYTDFYRP